MPTTTLDRTWYNTLVDDDGTNTTGSVWDKADVDSLMDAVDAVFAAAFNVTGPFRVGDDANASMTIGITINQGANDDEILALKSSDVDHGVTTLAETDTYGCIRKALAGSGGIEFRGFADTGLNHSVMFMRGIVTDTPSTTPATNVFGVVRVGAYLKSGTGTASIGSNGFLFSIDNAGSTKFLFDAEGDSHEDGTGWTAYDEYDDLALVDALDRTLDARLMEREASAFLRENRAFLQAARIVTFNDGGAPFINTSRLAMLHNGAIRQLYREVQNIRKALPA